MKISFLSLRFLRTSVTLQYLPKSGCETSKSFFDNSFFNSVKSHDLNKVIFNFLGDVLDTNGKSLLNKGTDFAVPPKNTNYADYMLSFELLYRDVDFMEVFNLDKKLIKGRFTCSAFSSYKDISKTFEKNLPKVEFNALKILLKKYISYYKKEILYL